MTAEQAVAKAQWEESNMSHESISMPSESTDPIIEARNVSVTYDLEHQDAMVLDDVDVDLRREEVLGVVGESGSGKSMLANTMMDAVQKPGITTGEIR